MTLEGSTLAPSAVTPFSGLLASTCMQHAHLIPGKGGGRGGGRGGGGLLKGRGRSRARKGWEEKEAECVKGASTRSGRRSKAGCRRG